MSEPFNHLNARGEVHMVNVGDKAVTSRRAVAEGRIEMQVQTLQAIITHTHKKGDVLAVARIAGIMASKKTAELIPLCHPVALTHVEIELIADVEHHAIQACATVECNAVTGVEMEALNAVQISLLTIYDMCKAQDRGMVIKDVCLRSKSGGKSGEWRRTSTP
jgi:cyclic pyranopterin phosphate synthase